MVTTNSISLVLMVYNKINKDKMRQCLEKPTGYHYEWIPSGGPKAKTQGATGPKGFLLRDFPMDSIHHDTPKAYPHIFILLSFLNSKEGFLSANGLFREYHGQCL